MGRAYQNRKESMAKTAGAKTKVYSKYGRELYVCAKAGGVDPDGNLALRGLLERAKKAKYLPMLSKRPWIRPKVVAAKISRQPATKVLALVVAWWLCDNPNRTFGDVRLCFTKTKCKIGTQGVVSHMFDHSAILAFKNDNEDAVLEALLTADVDVSDIESEEGKITVFTPHSEYFKAKQALLDTFGEIDFDVDEIQFLPKDSTAISGEDLEMFEKFLGMLNDLDDVQNIYHDADY